MQNLIRLFKLIELTRSQPQNGYALSGIRKQDLSDLAQHHYLVTFIAWQLANQLVAVGGKLDVLKVLGFALVHDLGELLGGDIGMPYARSNPKARKFAKMFEEENLKYLSKFFGTESIHFKKISKEVLLAKSDEALVAKVADYIEVTHYKAYMDKLTKGDVIMAVSSMKKKIKNIRDSINRQALSSFITTWEKEMSKQKYQEFFEFAKK